MSTTPGSDASAIWLTVLPLCSAAGVAWTGVTGVPEESPWTSSVPTAPALSPMTSATAAVARAPRAGDLPEVAHGCLRFERWRRQVRRRRPWNRAKLGPPCEEAKSLVRSVRRPTAAGRSPRSATRRSRAGARRRRRCPRSCARGRRRSTDSHEADVVELAVALPVEEDEVAGARRALGRRDVAAAAAQPVGHRAARSPRPRRPAPSGVPACAPIQDVKYAHHGPTPARAVAVRYSAMRALSLEPGGVLGDAELAQRERDPGGALRRRRRHDAGRRRARHRRDGRRRRRPAARTDGAGQRAQRHQGVARRDRLGRRQRAAWRRPRSARPTRQPTPWPARRSAAPGPPRPCRASAPACGRSSCSRRWRPTTPRWRPSGPRAAGGSPRRAARSPGAVRRRRPSRTPCHRLRAARA